MSEKIELNIDVKLKAATEIFDKQLRDSKGGIEGIILAYQDLLEVLKPGRGNKLSAEAKAAKTFIEQEIKLLKELAAAKKTSINTDVGAKTRAGVVGGTKQAVGMVKASGPDAIAAAKTKELAAAERELAKAEREVAKEARQAAQAVVKAEAEKEHAIRSAVFQSEEMAKSAITMRYSLYDVSSAARQVGQSFLTMSNSIIQAGAAQETSFTQVEKTLGGLDSDSVEKLKDDLIDLSTQIPVTFDEISKIAMLGSQMGVAEDSLASFTETVAQFSSVTGVATDSAAEGFGKIGTLLGLTTEAGQVNGEAMNALGSAIFAVGVESAATEQQIISTTRQIAAIGTQAGLGVGQVIGLASSLASLGVAPEESRGVIVQLFNEINKAASSYTVSLGKGSDELRVFTEVAKTGLQGISEQTKNATLTQEQFAEAWNNKSSNVIDWTDGITNASEVFQAFSAGLANYDSQDTLAKIGLDGVRTSKGLVTLSAGFKTLASQMDIATEAGQLGEALTEAYGKKADDFASKIQQLSGSFDALMASMSNDSGALDIFGAIADALRYVLDGFRGFQDAMNKAGLGGITAFALAATVLVGVVATLVAVLAGGFASFLAFKTSLAEAAKSGMLADTAMTKLALTLAGVNIEALRAAGGLKVVDAAQKGVAVSTGFAAAAMKTFKYALASTGIGILVLALGSIVAGFMEANDASEEAAKGGLQDFQKETQKANEQVAASVSELQALLIAIADVEGNARSLANAEYDLGKAAKAVGGDFNTQSQALRDYEDAVVNVINSAVKTYDGNQQALGEYLTQYRAYLVATGTSTVSTLKTIDAQLDELTRGGFDVGVSTLGQVNFSNITAGFKSVGSAAGGAAKAVDTLAEKIDKALKKIKSTADLRDSLRSLGSSIGEVGNSFDSMGEAGSQNIGNLTDTIDSIVEAAGGNAQKTANSLGALRKAMAQAGITSVYAYQAIDKAISATRKRAKISSSSVAQYFSLISSGMADAVKKNVRSIRDWADDIADVVGNAFDIRFDSTKSVDALTTLWADLSDEVQNANDSIKDLHNTMNGLKADRSILEYQLRIAQKYGDTLRAAALKGKLDQNNAELLKSQQDLQAQLDATNKTLLGNDTVAVGNRAKILDLVKAYQEYLATIAATTTDQGKLQDSANSMRQDFLDQALSLGFSQEQLLQYADAINVDFVTAVNNIPTEITLNLANTDPVIAAIATFVSKANSELDKIKVVDINGNAVTVDANANAPATPAPAPVVAPPVNITPPAASSGGSGSGSTAVKIGPKYAAQQKVVAAAEKKVADAAKALKTLKDQITALQKKAAGLKSGSTAWSTIQYQLRGLQMEYGYRGQAITPLNSTLQAATKKLAGMPKNLAYGGLVRGPGSNRSDSIPANLSNNEFVIQANAVRHYGADFMGALNNMKVPMSGGASAGSSGVVYLSPEDRALLRAAIDRPINLYTENSKIAASANAGNVTLAQRGAR